MNEPLFMNIFQSTDNIARNFKVWSLPIVTSDSKALYDMFRYLSRSGTADCAYHAGLVYFKGNPDRVRENLNQLPNTYLGTDLNEVSLPIAANVHLTVNLLYSAFERSLQSKNWRVLLKRKRAIPPLDEKFEEFHLKLSDDVSVLYGLKFMFEIRPDSDIFLWLDIYAPLWSITNKRRLVRSEISNELKSIYVNKALLRPKERFQKLQKMLNMLFHEKIAVEFCDGTSISFSNERYEVPFLQEEYVPSRPLQWALVEEPILRFKHGYSKNPRKIISQKAYGSSTIREILIKAIVAKSLKEDFLRLYENLVKGFSGSYASWPGFFDVTGAEIFFDEKNDVIEIGDNGEEDVLNGLIEVSRSLKENSVTFIVLPRISPRVYNKIKAEALRRRACTQVILKDTLTKEPFEFTLMNIAVALFAKAGGVPWILKDPLTAKRGLFVGISFHLDHEKKNIYYGVMEVFDRYGAHLICNAWMYKCPYEIRSVKGLFIPKEYAKKAINKLIDEHNPREIIFHKSAPFHNEEKEAIEEVCGQHNIDYCLVHVEGTNPYRVYAPLQEFAPVRGTIVYDSVNRNRAILVTTGQSVMEYRKIRPWSGIGTPRPLEIVIEKDRGSHMMREICEQLLALTKLDWNTTEVSVRLPITLKYSRKAARLAKYFEGITEGGLVDIAELKYLI